MEGDPSHLVLLSLLVQVRVCVCELERERECVFCIYVRVHVVHIQWNLSNLDTNGAEEVSLLVRCPQFRG